MLAAAAILVVAIAACYARPTDSLVACPADQIEGVLEPLGMPGSIGIMVGSRHLLINWANGYRATEVDGAMVVVSPTGAIVARAGDRVQLAGGEIRPGEWFTCGPPIVQQPPGT